MSEPLQAPETPDAPLVVRGPEPEVRRVQIGAAAIVLALFVVPSAMQAPGTVMPWGPTDPAIAWFVGFATVTIFMLVARWSLRRRLLRSGVVTFARDVIAFDKRVSFISSRRSTYGVRWPDITGYDDSDTNYVGLFTTHDRKPSSFLTIPTTDERQRVAVLRALDERGIRRSGA